MSKEKPERDSERHHEHDEERKEERGRRRLDHPQDGEADTLANGEQMHFQGSDLKKVKCIIKKKQKREYFSF
jgi:hypothetical protein